MIMYRIFFLLFLLQVLVAFPLYAATDAEKLISATNQNKFRAEIQAMKDSRKGPFIKIQWFCKDGSILPPKAYACAKHGGGIQHGLWSKTTLALHQAGFPVATVLAALDPKRFIGPDADLADLKLRLLERFLIAADDGWIFRGARNYRGALQAEDEEAASETLLLALLRDPLWLTPPRFALLREAVRLLPQKSHPVATTEVRQLSTKIHEQDPKFAELRTRIHGTPSAEDAKRVRDYAQTQGKKEYQADYKRLADGIDTIFSAQTLLGTLKSILPKIKNADFQQKLRRGYKIFNATSQPEEQLVLASELMMEIRHVLSRKNSARTRLGLLRVSLALEQEVFRVGASLTAKINTTPRRQQFLWLGSVAKALYGAGFLYDRHLEAMDDTLTRLLANKNLRVSDYHKTVTYLARAIGWSDRTWAFHFKESQDHLAILEPLVTLYSQDRLRGSPLLFFGALIDTMVTDANHLAHREHRLFGHPAGAGIRALNSGLARGILHTNLQDLSNTDPQGIYLLPETTSDLTPVAGILTRGEGNALSHVQLLARNLAIPNAVIGEQWLEELRRHNGSPVVISITPDGVVTLENDSPAWDSFFAEKKTASPTNILIRPDLEKLDLESQNFISLTQLRAHDSGRLAGPKGANLGELKHLFGDVVPSGFVIPFGVFRAFLEQPLETGGPTVFDWMKRSYADIDTLPEGSEIRRDKTRQFLSRLRQRIETSDPGSQFRQKLRVALSDHFGEDKRFGVFVRSDTNVEDLPGFTGAGLNRTIANVVGYDAIVQAIQQVWASPFTERAYAWRQSHMDQPYNVFPAVLIQHSFPAQKSGVMVSKDVVWGEAGWISIAVNEGVGGAVDGQAAESLRVHLESGETQLLAHATAPYRRLLTSSANGLQKIPASGSDRVLEADEIRQLITLAQTIPEKFPSLRDENNNPMPADVEFAFQEGRLALLQIRPFVEAKGAKRLGFVSPDKTSNLQQEDPNVSLDAIPVSLPSQPERGL